MEFGSSQVRNSQGKGPQKAGGEAAAPGTSWMASGLPTEGEPVMQRMSRIQQLGAVRAHSVAELLECPAPVGLLLSNSAQCLKYQAGEAVFHRSMSCLGLYLVLSGRLLLQAEWNQTPVTLATASAGELLELAAVLGGGRHLFTLTAQTASSVLLLPMEAISQAFQCYAPLRMRLLEELAREVSRAYYNCCPCRPALLRRTSSAA